MVIVEARSMIVSHILIVQMVKCTQMALVLNNLVQQSHVQSKNLTNVLMVLVEIILSIVLKMLNALHPLQFVAQVVYVLIQELTVQLLRFVNNQIGHYVQISVVFLHLNHVIDNKAVLLEPLLVKMAAVYPQNSIANVHHVQSINHSFVMMDSVFQIVNHVIFLTVVLPLLLSNVAMVYVWEKWLNVQITILLPVQ